MIVFPQLTTGASALYPVSRVPKMRTVMNSTLGGYSIAASDALASSLEWELRATGLSRVERDAIEDLHRQSQGALRTFTFLSPVGNALTYSEEFAGTGWVRSAQIQTTTGVADPFGTVRAVGIVNAGQAPGTIQQALPVPGDYSYCFSIWARSSAGSTVTMGYAGASRTQPLNSSWQRISIAGNQHAIADTVTFAMTIAAGASVELFGAQVEPQLAPSDYKRTGGRGGVYSNARFASDELSITAQATDVYDAIIRIVSTES